MRPTEAEWFQMKQYTSVAAAQRPANIRALFEKYAAWRAANSGWQNWNAQQFRAAVQGQPAAAPPPPPPSAPPPASGGGGAAPGAGASQNPVQAGGVWWGGKFYATPYQLRVALGMGKPNDADRQRWRAWLDAHPAIKVWATGASGGAEGGEGAGGPEGEGGEGGDPGAGEPMPEEGGGVTPPQITGPTDWSGMLGIAGLPPDLVAQITGIFSRVTDTNAAIAMALGVVRGSAWYAQTFPGITQGIQHGLFADERGYRDYRNALDGVYRQWTGAPITSESLMAALAEGVSPDIVGRRFEGRAFVETNRPDLQYVSGAFGTGTDLGQQGGTRFSEDQLQAMGQHQAGLGTPGALGMKVARAAQLAQERLNRAFEGVAASPQMALNTRGQLFSPGLRPGGARPDVPA